VKLYKVDNSQTLSSVMGGRIGVGVGGIGLGDDVCVDCGDGGISVALSMAGGDGSLVGAAHANSKILIPINIIRANQRAINLFISIDLRQIFTSDHSQQLLDVFWRGNHSSPAPAMCDRGYFPSVFGLSKK